MPSNDVLLPAGVAHFTLWTDLDLAAKAAIIPGGAVCRLESNFRHYYIFFKDFEEEKTDSTLEDETKKTATLQTFT